MNADELGNDHGLQCPKCKSGETLQIQVLRWANLLPNGTEDEAGDTEWDETSPAQCSCGWEGKVGDFIVIELDEEGTCPHCGGDTSECGGETFVNKYRCPGNLEHRQQHEPLEWQDSWCCACDDKCPTCNAEIEPEAEAEPESQASKHADAGYMNDVRFGEGDGPDF